MTQQPDDGAQVDVEAAWAQIVMHWDDDRSAGSADPAGQPGAGEPTGPGRPRGESESVPGPDDHSGDRPAAAPAPTRAHPTAAPPVQPQQPQQVVQPSRTQPAADAADDDDVLGLDDRFVPEEPPPLPRGDLVSWLAWGGVLGAPLFLVFAAVVWQSAPSVVVAAAVTAFVAGFATLVARMPDRRDDDSDDGAVV